MTANTAFVGWLPVSSTWYHIAVTREGDTIRVFIDGTLQTLDGASATLDPDERFFYTTSPLSWNSIDGNFGGGNPFDNFEGLCFDMRFVSEKALYTTSFTRPSKHLPQFGQLKPADY